MSSSGAANGAHAAAPALHLAHLSDMHLAPGPTGNGLVLQGETERLLRAAVQQLQGIADLDAVLVTGDLIDDGTPASLATAVELLNTLPVPWFAVPGNHDISFPPDEAHLDRRSFYAALQDRAPRGAAAYVGAGARGCWTVLLKPGVRLVGLDSNIPGDWGGQIDAGQLAWLETTLGAAAEPLVVLLVHHPLHRVFGGWTRPTFADQPWDKFFCANAPAVDAVLARHPAVRLVLSGHDHVSRVDQAAGRLCMSAPALSSYPLAYRVLRVAPQESGWTCTWQTYSPADVALRKRALRQLERSDVARGYDPREPRRFADVSEGEPADQQNRSWLPAVSARHGR